MSHFFDDLEAQLRAAVKQETASDAPAHPWWRRRGNVALIAVVAAGRLHPPSRGSPASGIRASLLNRPRRP